MFCNKCGKEINDEAVICVHCGCLTNSKGKQITQGSTVGTTSFDGKSNWVIAYMLSWFLGVFGAHRFYLGHVATGIAQFLTLGGCVIWSLIDFGLLSFNKFRDSKGNELTGFVPTLGIVGFILCILGCILVTIATLI